MELRQFVSTVLEQIVAGVKDAHAAAETTGAVVVPKIPLSASREGADLWKGGSLHRGRPLVDVEFDVAVTTSESGGTKGGAGVFVGSFGLGASKESAEEKVSVSRIKFHVPVVLPTQSERG